MFSCSNLSPPMYGGCFLGKMPVANLFGYWAARITYAFGKTGRGVRQK